MTHEFLAGLVLGNALGGALVGYAAYWVATHIGSVRADIAKATGQIGALEAKLNSAVAARAAAINAKAPAAPAPPATPGS